MRKVVGILNILMIAAVCVGNYFFLTIGGLPIKALCSGIFALLGLVNLCYGFYGKEKNIRFSVAMTVGLILAMLGDIVLCFDFILGASLFAAGHICYFIAYCFLMSFIRKDWLLCGGTAVAVGAFVFFCPLFSFEEPVFRWVCLCYALIISAMLGKAVSNFLSRKNSLTAILALGSILFFFSDLMLALDWFAGMGRLTGILCMATYYPAECLLASSLYVKTSRKL